MGGLFNWLMTLGRPRRVPIAEALWQRALQQAAWTSALEPGTRLRLRRFAERFLADKAITPAGGLAMTDERKVLIAMLCCRPVLVPGYDWLRGWAEVIVYPSAFKVPTRELDLHTGVVHERDVAVSGQAWTHGPLLLAWTDVERSLHAPRPGYDVVAHEIAHKIDVLDGDMDGAPWLVAVRRAAWARDFQEAFDRLREDVAAGREPIIDPYAAIEPAEFFAVCSEYWFTAPEHLREVMPEVAHRLSDFYGEP
jgi:MtfA peptidase